MGQYKHHVFICTSGKHCPKDGAEQVLGLMRDATKAAGLKGIVRINHAGCMSQCGHGPMVVVYPDDIWYAAVDPAGAERIVAEHLVGGVPVEAYRYHAPPGDNKSVQDDGAKGDTGLPRP
jgi:(2Fe-2S) ferredoxin